MSEDSGHAKVRDFDDFILVQEQVFRLYIPVGDPLSVEVRQAGDDLLEEPLRPALVHPTVRLDPVKQLASAAILQENILAVAVLPAAVTLNNLFMFQQFVNTNFFLDL